MSRAFGNRQGDSVSIRISDLAAPLHLNEIGLPIQIRLKAMLLKHVQLWLRENVWGWFSESARNNAKADRRLLIQGHVEDVAIQFEAAWGIYHRLLLAECQRSISTAFGEMLRSIDAANVSLQ